MNSSALDVPCIILYNKLFQCAVRLSDVWGMDCVYALSCQRDFLWNISNLWNISDCGTFRRCIRSSSDLAGVNISTSFIFSVLAYLLYSGHCLCSSFEIVH